MASERHRILVMRHPQTTANVEGVLSGRTDVDLTPEGERQMYRAIQALADWRPDRIMTSPLSRCRSIAFEASELCGAPCTVEPLLQEIEFGAVQGRTAAAARELGWPFPWQLDGSGRSVAAPGAESFEELYLRAQRMLDLLAQAEGRTALVTHGGFTRGLLGAALKLPLDTFWHLRLPNVSSQVLTYDGFSFGLAALGLAPEEVSRRMREPALLGQDTTEHLRA